MSTEVEKKAAAIGHPFGDGSTTNVRKLALSTTEASTALPADWAGRLVTVQPQGGAAWVLFSIGTAGIEVDATVTASSDATLGKKIADGDEKHFQVPALDQQPKDKSVYINYEGDTDSTYLEVVLADGEGSQL